LEGEAELLDTMSHADKTGRIDKAISVIVFCLRDKNLREVANETTNNVMWIRLESLYMTNLLAHRQFLKQ